MGRKGTIKEAPIVSPTRLQPKVEVEDVDQGDDYDDETVDTFLTGIEASLGAPGLTEPQLQILVKLEQNTEPDPFQSICNSQHDNLENPFSTQISEDPDIDIGDVVVKVEQYPLDGLVLHEDDEDCDAKISSSPKPEDSGTSTSTSKLSSRRVCTRLAAKDTSSITGSRNSYEKSPNYISEDEVKDEYFVMAPNGFKYVCKTCGKLFPRRGPFEIHMRTHTGDKPFSCEICNRAFHNPHILRRHLLITHSTEKPFKCNICNKSTINELNLMRFHSVVHTRVKEFGCEHCGKKFGLNCNLKRHIKAIHMKVSKAHIDCVFCPLKCETYTILEIHLRSHIKERPYFCNLCPAEMMSKSDLNRHVKTHDSNRERNFPCLVCGERFYASDKLKGHMVVHVEKRQFKCDLCKASYKRKRALIMHRRIHTGERPFPCTHCEKKFKSKPELIIHVRSHTGEKPYKCTNTDCGLAFSCSSNLKRHRKKCV